MKNALVSILISLIVVIVVVEGGPEAKKDPNWQAFKLIYKHDYPSEKEEDLRYSIFVENTQKASALIDADPHATYGINDKTDYALSELTGLVDVPTTLSDVVRVDDEIAIPSLYDARSHGLVNSVRDQKKSKASWAFATSSLVEAAYKTSHETLPSLSDQQLIDCVEGGYPTQAMKYLQEYGQMKRSEYKFKGKKGECAFNKEKVHAKVMTYMNIASSQEDIMKAVLKYGAVGAVVDAAKFSTYSGGIMNGEFCDKDNVNLAVVIVGWGTKDDVPYWVVRNSWGNKWGESGYFRIQRGINACGIEQRPMALTVE